MTALAYELVGSRGEPDPGPAGPTLLLVPAGIADRRMWVVLDGSAHLPSMERPDEFNRVVLEFLAKLDRSP